MRLTYVSLSPTFGMSQYTADLANQGARPAAGSSAPAAWRVCAVTNQAARPDRFGPQVERHVVPGVNGTGLKPGNFDPRRFRQAYRTIVESKPEIVHFTSPHIWNPILLWLLRRRGIATVHTIHDIDPHSGSSYGRLLYVWNNSIKRLASHILVHSQTSRARLIADGLMADRVTQVPLLHLFVSYESEQRLLQQQSSTPTPAAQNGAPFALFFARLEPYKGIDVLLTALRQLEGQSPVQAIIAGQGDVEPYTRRGLPTNVELRNRQIGDEEAIELFKNCLVVVLPYLDATQSALVAAAYFFGKPVIVTRAGALPEYVVTGKTGWVIEPRDAPALAACLHQASSDRLTLAQMGQAGREWYMTQRRAERHALHMMYEQVRQGAAAEAN